MHLRVLKISLFISITDIVKLEYRFCIIVVILYVFKSVAKAYFFAKVLYID